MDRQWSQDNGDWVEASDGWLQYTHSPPAYIHSTVTLVHQIKKCYLPGYPSDNGFQMSVHFLSANDC